MVCYFMRIEDAASSSSNTILVDHTKGMTEARQAIVLGVDQLDTVRTTLPLACPFSRYSCAALHGRQ